MYLDCGKGYRVVLAVWFGKGQGCLLGFVFGVAFKPKIPKPRAA